MGGGGGPVTQVKGEVVRGGFCTQMELLVEKLKYSGGKRSLQMEVFKLGGGGLTHGCDHTGGVVGGKGEAGGGVHGCGGGQHVAGVREGREGGHVAGQGGRAEGAALVHQAFGEVVHAVLGLFALLGLAGHLPVPGLDALLLHGQRSVNLLSKGDRKDFTLAGFPPFPEWLMEKLLRVQRLDRSKDTQRRPARRCLAVYTWESELDCVRARRERKEA